jgi:hypothetical protein
MAPNLPIIFAINSLVVMAVVMIHYEGLLWMTRIIPKMRIPHRYRIVFGVFGSLLAHAVEIWIFALAYYFMHRADGWGQLSGNHEGTYFDCVYYSFSTFSTLGYGDIVPLGVLRYLTGIEALTGLVLITWSASFLYVEMQRNWEVRDI